MEGFEEQGSNNAPEPRTMELVVGRMRKRRHHRGRRMKQPHEDEDAQLSSSNANAANTPEEVIESQIDLSSPKIPAVSPAHDVSANNVHHAEPDVSLPRPSSPGEQNVRSPAPEETQDSVHPSSDEIGTYNTELSSKDAKVHWDIREPSGGRLDGNLAFTPDEEFLFLSNRKAVQVYSKNTSLLEHTLPVSDGCLAAHTTSAVNPHLIFVLASTGFLSLWDWHVEKKVARWDIGDERIIRWRQLVSVTHSAISHEWLYCLGAGKKHHVIQVHALRTGSEAEASHTESKQVLEVRSKVTSFQVVSNGQLLVVQCEDFILIGKATLEDTKNLDDLDYSWIECRLPNRMTTFHAYLRPEQSTKPQSLTLDLAVGYHDGSISIFENVLGHSVYSEASEAGQSLALELLQPTRHHWHRDAVGAVKWSHDGKYIISGGKEMVLVIWQLATGTQQTLPHLTSAVEKIVVSPKGTSYAVSLANNSVIVLSTSELEAQANIVGVQSRRVDLQDLPCVSAAAYPFEIFRRVPMAITSRDTSRIIFASPSSQDTYSDAGCIVSEPYIQTYDVDMSLHVSRQAVTRTNATDLNTSPDMTTIAEPTVHFIRSSLDGEWLATVDEWMPPPPGETEIEEAMSEFLEYERATRREVCLKFWQWDTEAGTWNLHTKIDKPHPLEVDSASARVLDLVSMSTEVGFATVGEDGSVRFWKPKSRRLQSRKGLKARSSKSDGPVITAWTSTRTIEIGHGLNVERAYPYRHSRQMKRKACLAFSADGSVLAVALDTPPYDPGFVLIIRTATGEVEHTIAELGIRNLSCLGIIERYLITVGDIIEVWDLVQQRIIDWTNLDNLPGADKIDRSSMMNLALNEKEQRFVVSVPIFQVRERTLAKGVLDFSDVSTKLFFGDLKSLSDVNLDEGVESTIEGMEDESQSSHNNPPIIRTMVVPGLILGLQPHQLTKGFVALDSSSSIRLITPKVRHFPPPNAWVPSDIDSEDQISWDDESDQDIEVCDKSGDAMDVDAGKAQDEISLRMGSMLRVALDEGEVEKPVVQPEQLEAALEHAVNTREVFHAVAELFMRKPRERKNNDGDGGDAGAAAEA